jgi:hypothetical protein
MITLGTASGSGNSNLAAGTPVYTPASGIKDISGNTLSTNPFTAASASRF